MVLAESNFSDARFWAASLQLVFLSLNFRNLEGAYVSEP